jgi:outer membrane protein OmpA-like peptidoglycan-associated protein
MRHRTAALAVILAASLVRTAAAAELVNMLSFQEGTLPAVEPSTYASWTALTMLDDSPSSGWAAETGHVKNNVFVFELANAAVTFERFELDTARIDGDGRGARHVVVEVSPTGKDAGFVEVARGELADRADGQQLAATKKVAGRWVRLTVADNHGDPEWVELMGFRGFAPRPSPATPLAVSGTFESDYGLFHLRQQGTALGGCYEHDGGLLEGSIDGRVMKLTWHEDGGPGDKGPALMIVTPDGKAFRGFWWAGDAEQTANGAGTWDGKWQSAAVGSCPHWSGSVGGEVKKSLATSGRAVLHGILFDLDSATLRAESKPVLDEVVHLLAAETAWKLTIEGHTDSSGAAAHNQALSEQRAASVKAYLVSQGVDAARLSTAGFGSSHPVADNASELGRAQNRRVELVKR